MHIFQTTKSQIPKFVSFKRKDLIYQFLCLCFGLGPTPRIFTKLLKVTISLRRKLNVWLIIFLDDILLMAASVKELTLARDTRIYLVQNLGFLINIKKFVLQPCQTIQFLGMKINSIYRCDYNSSTGEKESDSKTMSGSSEEVISFNTGVD